MFFERTPLHFWLPFGVIVVLALIWPFCSGYCIELIYRENGLVEMTQAVIALVAAVIGFKTLKHCKGERWLKVWVGGAALACLYICLEELSYGQQLFKWGTSDFWLQVNDQQETNLHNTSSWFDQKPRLLLFIGIIVGGIIIPLLRRFKPETLPKRFEVVYPRDNLFWIAVMVFLVHWAEIPGKLWGINIYYRPSEIEELLMYYFVLMYLIDFRQRMIKLA